MDTADAPGSSSKVVRFTDAKKATLSSFYKAGMNGVGVRHLNAMKMCSEEIGCSIEKVKSWIKKKNYRTKHAKPKGKVTKLKRVTPWQHFLNDYGKTAEGRTAIKDFKTFTKTASHAYGLLHTPEKEELRKRASQQTSLVLEVAAVKRNATKIFSQIQKQMAELEDLGYSGLAFAFFDDDVQYTSTSTAAECATPIFLDYLRSVIVANNPPPVECSKCKCGFSPACESRRKRAKIVSSSDSDVEETSSKVRAKQYHEEKSRPKHSHLVGVPKATGMARRNLTGAVKEAARTPTGAVKKTVTPAGAVKKTVTPAGAVKKTVTSAGVVKKTVTSAGKVKETATSVGAVKKAVISAGAVKETATSVGAVEETAGAVKQTVTSAAAVEETVTLEGTVKEANTSTGTCVEAKIDVSKAASSFIEGSFPPPSLLSDLLLTSSQNVSTSSSEAISISSSPVKDDSMLWVPELELYQRDKDILGSSQWLNDGIIFAAQSMLRAQTEGKFFGWQSTQCSRRTGLFSEVPPFSPFIQILHTGECHWVTTSNVNVHDGSCFQDTVGLYDSGKPTSIHSDVKKSVCSFYKCRGDILRFDIMNVVGQPNANDCGLHAIAYATELAHGSDPVKCNWDFNSMRPHLIQCFESGTLKQFPKASERKIRFGTRVRKSLTFRVYCIGRTMNDESRPMIECTKCLKWYHKDCMKLDPDKSYSAVKWVCIACTKLLN